MEVAGPAELLAALGVDSIALLVLLLAGVSAGVAALGTLVDLALAGVLVVVELEGVLAPVVKQVVAADQGQLDATDGLARGVAVLVVGGLLADVGGLRSASGGDGRLGAAGLGSAGGRARIDAGGDGRRLGGNGSVLVEAGLLVALALKAAGVGVAELLDAAAPLGEVEAVQDTGPASLLEARGDVASTGLVGAQAVLLVVPVRDGRSTPVTALVLALRGLGDGGGAKSSRGGRRNLSRRLGGGGGNRGHSAGGSAGDGSLRRGSDRSLRGGGDGNLGGAGVGNLRGRGVRNLRRRGLRSLGRSGLGNLRGRSLGNLRRRGVRDSRRSGDGDQRGAGLLGGSVAARLQRLELLGDVDVQAVAATALLGGIALAVDVALSGRSGNSVVGEDRTAPTLLCRNGLAQQKTIMLQGYQNLRPYSVPARGKPLALQAARHLAVVKVAVSSFWGQDRVGPGVESSSV